MGLVSFIVIKNMYEIIHNKYDDIEPDIEKYFINLQNIETIKVFNLEERFLFLTMVSKETHLLAGNIKENMKALGINSEDITLLLSEIDSEKDD